MIEEKTQKVWHVTQIMYGALSVLLGAFLYQLYSSFGGLKLKCLFLMLKQQLSKFGSYSKLAATHLADIHDLNHGASVTKLVNGYGKLRMKLILEAKQTSQANNWVLQQFRLVTCL